MGKIESDTPLNFEVNDFITLKFEKEKTNIYVKGRFFNQCKYLLLNIPTDKIREYDEIDSIDDAAEKLDHSQEPISKDTPSKIPLDVAFWGHCSNLQAWAEHSYDTRLLHRNIAFPLLKKLTDVGDPIAKNVFKEEIAIRFISGHQSVVGYLIAQGYLNYLNQDDMNTIIEDVDDHSVLVQLCYNLLKNENELYSISLRDRFEEMDEVSLKETIYIILKLILEEKKHVWRMETLGGDFHSIQMKILIKLKTSYMKIVQTNVNHTDMSQVIQDFLKMIYRLTFESVDGINRNFDFHNPNTLDEQFEFTFNKIISEKQSLNPN